jgi:hypothetical protein
MYKSPGIDQISTELIKVGGSKICSEIHKLIIAIWNNEELPDQWKESVVVPIYKKGDEQIVVTIAAYHSCQQHTEFYQISFCQG